MIFPNLPVKMRKRIVSALFVIFGVALFAFLQKSEIKRVEAAKNQAFSEIKPQMVQAVAAAVSEKVSDFAPAVPENGQTGKKTADEKARAVANNLPFRKQLETARRDAETDFARFSNAQMPAPALSFEGLSSRDNAAAYGFRIIPPDTFGDVGPNHYVQAVNALLRVFDKNGNALTPPFKLSSLFAPLGTVCSTRNDGDPIVLYDALADRWLISQFCTQFPPFRQMVAVSKTGDPTGEYFIYEFAMPNVKLNDYSKIGVWSDAFYMTTDQFLGSDYAGSGVFAFDKAKMMRGDASAGYIYFDLASPATIRLGGLLPADFDGINAPPENAPNVFLGYSATEYGDAADAIRLFDFRADFQNPSNSTFAERPESPIPVAPFDPTSTDGRADIAQPAPGERLDSQSDRLMYRAAYRNFGAHESIVFNQTVRTSPLDQAYRAGVRVYELRKTNGKFAVHEQSTVGNSGESRWMASAAQDHQGNLAVGYSFVSDAKKPSVYYTGKLAADPAGTFRAETALIDGTGVQTAFGFRWGDYSAMSVDPLDDCTFWLTNEYYTQESENESPFGWLTRIGKFKFDECTPAPRAVIKGNVVNSANGEPIENAVVTANSIYSRSAGKNGNYNDFLLLPGEYSLTASAKGFRSQSFIVSAADGQTLTQNFALALTAVLYAAKTEITAESCAANQAIEPGETISVNVTLRNSGTQNAENLTATLLPTGGVTNPSEPQNYGVLYANARSATRSFSFTASPNLNCGEPVVLTFALQDGAENLAPVSIKLATGEKRIALRESFDAVSAPDFPEKWTTDASGGQLKWTTSTVQKQSAPNSAFSPATSEIGVNELVSPFFQIVSENAEIEFRNRYELETTFLRNKLYDGSVLEIKIGDADWQDIETAGGAFLSGGYDGTIDGCCQNPLAGRRAWSGKSGTNQTPVFIDSKAKLPASAAGKDVRIRFRVATDNGTFREGQYIDDLVVSDGFVCRCENTRKSGAPFDFDGDGKTDFAVFRPTDADGEADFFIENSSDNSLQNAAWGSAGDFAANADYDGDGKTDLAVFRPSAHTWFILNSSIFSISTAYFGLAGDKLTPADYDGDGRADVSVFRPSNGTWYRINSSDGKFAAQQFGADGDVPVQADYDGDNKIDIAVFRPTDGFWYVSRSSDGGFSAAKFGAGGDKPVAGDFDGDGEADFAVFRPADGNWYFLQSAEGFKAVKFGLADDKPLQADFDGDKRLDIAVFRRSTNVWYYLKSSGGDFAFKAFDAGDDVAIPSIFVY
jgi:hypothetical protein